MAAEDGQAATGVEKRHRLAVERLRRRADRVDAQIGRVSDGGDSSGLGEVWIAAQIAFFNDHVPHRNRVPIREPIVPIVAALAELAEASDGFDRACVGAEPEIAAGDGDGLFRRVARLANGPAATAVGAVDPIIEAPGQSVDAELLVPG